MNRESFLDIIKSTDCKRCSNADEREAHMSNGFCDIRSVKDGLPIRCVGNWGKDKAYFVATYVDIVGCALHEKFDVNYIEICSGPGRCIDYESGDEFNGTPLTVMSAPGTLFLTNLYFFDINPEATSILDTRIRRSGKFAEELKQKTIVSVGDYTQGKSIVETVANNTTHQRHPLNIIFIDPTDLSVPYEMYENLLSLSGATDFIINFPEGTDLKRNIVNAVKNPDLAVSKKYARALRDKRFFDNSDLRILAEENNHVELTQRYVQEFLQPFKTHGYTQISQKEIMWYYKLIHLSKDPLGANFWNKACKKTALEREERQGLLF